MRPLLTLDMFLLFPVYKNNNIFMFTLPGLVMSLHFIILSQKNFIPAKRQHAVTVNVSMLLGSR